METIGYRGACQDCPLSCPSITSASPTQTFCRGREYRLRVRTRYHSPRGAPLGLVSARHTDCVPGLLEEAEGVPLEGCGACPLRNPRPGGAPRA